MLELSDYPNTGQVRVYDIEAISLPIVYNKYGDHDPNGLMYVLKKDSERIQRKARENFSLPVPQPYEGVQPLVIRANLGDTVQINFENKLNRRASIHVQGLSYDVLTSDGANVGYNPIGGNLRKKDKKAHSRQKCGIIKSANKNQPQRGLLWTNLIIH